MAEKMRSEIELKNIEDFKKCLDDYGIIVNIPKIGKKGKKPVVICWDDDVFGSEQCVWATIKNFNKDEFGFEFEFENGDGEITFSDCKMKSLKGLVGECESLTFERCNNIEEFDNNLKDVFALCFDECEINFIKNPPKVFQWTFSDCNFKDISWLKNCKWEAVCLCDEANYRSYGWEEDHKLFDDYESFKSFIENEYKVPSKQFAMEF